MSSHTTGGGNRGRDPDIDLSEEDSLTEREPEDPALSEDDMFEVLYNNRRRLVLEYLRATDGTASAGELAEHVASEETDTTVQELSSYDRKRVYVSLYQNHLPVMDDANVVEYEEDRKQVRLLDTVSKCEPYLESDTETADSRLPVAMALAIAGFVLVGSLQVGVFAATPVSGWAVLGVVGLLSVVGFEAYGT